VKSVIVPLDGSQRAERALAHAAALAGQLDAELVLVTHQRGGVVVDPLGYLADRAAAVGHPGADCRLLVDGYPAAAFAQLADELPEATVVMSTRGHGRVSGALLGGVAQQVLRLASAPIVLVGPSCHPAPEPVRQLVLASRAVPPPVEVLREVGRWCQQLSASLRVLSIAEPSSERDDIEELRARLGERLSSPSELLMPTPRISVVRGDDIAEAVTAFVGAQPDALVAVSTSAPTGLARLRRGSVGADVVRRAHGPVLLLRAPAGASPAGG
jgi:nucleotide-binding universal stress UspA family protein